MEQYISKSALIAEIEKIRCKVDDGSSYCNGWQHALRTFEIGINNLEVKEVDFEKEAELIANGIMISVQANKYGTNIYNTERNDFNHHHLQMAARKGIELGLNTQKEKLDWSEEDEDRVKTVLYILHEAADNYNFDEWLKSLKDRMQPQSKQELSEDITNEYIDLGLPSGTLWKSVNEEGYYTFDEAVEKFSSQLPSKNQLEELKDKCKWEWKGNGYEVTGPNGKSIFLPAAGYRYGTNTYGFVGMNGYYWSNMYASMYFHDKFHGIRYDGRNYGLSVRLVK